MEPAAGIFTEYTFGGHKQKAEIKIVAARGWPADEVFDLMQEQMGDDAPGHKDFHCPGGPVMEIHALARIFEITKLGEMQFKELIKEIVMKIMILSIVVVPMIGIALEIQKVQQIMQMLFQIAVVILLWKMLEIATTKIAPHIMGIHGGISKMHFTETGLGGMQIQRLMQICDKSTSMERRLMEMRSTTHDFVRILRSDILQQDSLA